MSFLSDTRGSQGNKGDCLAVLRPGQGHSRDNLHGTVTSP